MLMVLLFLLGGMFAVSTAATVATLYKMWRG